MFTDFSSDSDSSSSDNASKSSDSDSSDDDDSADENEQQQQTKPTKTATTSSDSGKTHESKKDILDGDDVQMTLDIEDKGAASSAWKMTKFDSDDEEDTSVKHPKAKIEKATNGESDKVDPDVKDNNDAFTEYYLSLMTGGAFGDDLNKVRESNDFGDGKTSMPLLVAALKEGVNMFDKEQRELIWSAHKK